MHYMQIVDHNNKLCTLRASGVSHSLYIQWSAQSARPQYALHRVLLDVLCLAKQTYYVTRASYNNY